MPADPGISPVPDEISAIEDLACSSTIGESVPATKLPGESIGTGLNRLSGVSRGLAAVNAGENSVTTSDIREG